MYFFRVKPLREELAGPGLTERARLHYLMAWMIALTVLSIHSRPDSVWSIGSGWLVVGITVAGILYAYRKNGGPGGRSFLDRYLSIGWVMNFRLLVFLTLAFELLGGMATLAGYSAVLEDVEEPLGALITIAAETYLAFAIARQVGLVAGGSVPRTVPAPAETAVPAAAPNLRLEKFVEAVVQRELSHADRTPRQRTGRRTASRSPRKR